MFVLLAVLGCSKAENSHQPLRVLLDQPPVTLNPRSALDAPGQRLGALLFRALTRIDADLQPQPDLSESWEVLDGGKTWKFKIRPGQVDHSGSAISARMIAECVDNYMNSKPYSPFRDAFRNLKSTEVKGAELIIHLSSPDPYLARNVSLLRFFRTESGKTPCEEPRPGEAVIGSGSFFPLKWEMTPETHITFLPENPARDRPLDFEFSEEENSRALKVLSGEVDLAPTSLSITKTRWLIESYPGKFDLFLRDGIKVSYLAFNLREPILSKKNVRRAISMAIDRESYVRNKLLGWGSVAGSLLSPKLPESWQAKFPYDPAEAERLLDQAGFPRKAGGTRFRLHYRTTPIRDGYETALIFKDALSRIGIDLVVDVVEPAVFFAEIRKGHFDLYSSRWIGISDGSILYKTLHSGEPNNRGGYRNPEVDRLLERALAEPALGRRAAILAKVQKIAAEDLPFFPLWYWNNAILVKKGAFRVDPRGISLSGALEPLFRHSWP